MIPKLRHINTPPNILVVGAGGIGCEIVKSLAIAGYTNMTVIDFDTVSLSNLSRQFFYSEKDIGVEKSKALAANASRLYPNLNITGLYMNVMTHDFSMSFVNQFDFVFCAVDNMAARKKVNQLCVFSQILEIDCASSGKSAQSVPVIPYSSECYDCTPGSEPSGPKITCTIRSTPENYEHCAAWAFHLFNSMYAHNESTDVVTVEEGSSPFTAVFVDRIRELQNNTEMWKHRDPPNVVGIDAEANSEPANRQRDVWTDEESVSVFKWASSVLKAPQTFDKDDNLHMAFATAAANLQARAFSIERRCSMFDAKGLVSVVEPALATTNSVISGIAVLQMDRMIKAAIQNQSNDATYQGKNPVTSSVKSVWMAHDNKGPRLSPASLAPPNRDCAICGVELYRVCCPFSQTMLARVGQEVGASAPSIVKDGKIIYDADDDNDRSLEEAGIVDGDILLVADLDGDDDKMKTVVVRAAGEYSIEHLRSVEKKEVKASSDYSDEYSDIIEIKCNK
ncbi:hypothetical protein TRFO_37745 [Tritrichomonas foetus]|uniref:SUMO-activating enzyme subunit n=1 Tax=Tritrichomonas foetus TaxID=1144522 RepID=A0A1J4JBS1_9EUKA|nr:hypothetical protein TRFO_37745 [Tritrichomonas foetus]|eukprot:OHS96105.1 hypothetical protein TRFO_37745 [Tritrichomonas foetus]